MIGDDEVGSGALDGQQRLHHHGPLVEPAIGGRRLEHGVLAAHVVGGHREPGLALDAVDQVEVRQGRLDHHHVGAFLDIHDGLAHALVGVRGVHLIRLAVAELRRRLGRLAERPVEGRRVLGAVREDGHVLVVLVVESGADGGDAAVHHVRRRHHIDARLGVAESGLGQKFDAQVVVDTAILAHDAAVTVTHILTETDVGDDRELRDVLLDRPDRHLHDALGVVGGRSRLVLGVGDAEEQHAADAESGDLSGFLDQVADGELVDPGHGTHRVLDVFPVDHEEGIDEDVWMQMCLPDHGAQAVGLAHPPGTVLGIVHRLS